MSAHHRSRGNDWAALSWAALVGHLPDDDPRRLDAHRLSREFMAAVVGYQDADGMWRQKMTLHDQRSYPETSGTSYREHFLRRLRGCLNYIEPDGSVSHTRRGTLCPGDGSIDACLKRDWIMNDPYGFGPAVLALIQAHRIGQGAGFAGVRPCFRFPGRVML